MPRNLMQPHKRMEARRKIEAEIRGRAERGERLAGERELARRLGFGRNTVRAAMVELEMSGLIERRVGAGTFVSGRAGGRSGRSGRLARVAVIASRHFEASAQWSFEGELIRAMATCAPRVRTELLVLAAEIETERQQLADLRGLRRFDGFISVGMGDHDLAARLIELRRGPVVSMNEHFRDLPVVSVTDGSFAGARAAARHLLRLGHRRVAFINCHNPAANNPDKFAGYRAALAEKQLPVDESLVAEVPEANDAREAFSEEFVARILAGPAPATAVLGFDDLHTLPVIRALERRGLRPGRDISVSGQGDSAFRQGLCDWLTSTRIAYGKMAAEALRAATTGAPPAEGRTVIVPNRLLVRKSTCPPSPKGFGGLRSLGEGACPPAAGKKTSEGV